MRFLSEPTQSNPLVCVLYTIEWTNESSSQMLWCQPWLISVVNRTFSSWHNLFVPEAVRVQNMLAIRGFLTFPSHTRACDWKKKSGITLKCVEWNTNSKWTSTGTKKRITGSGVLYTNQWNTKEEALWQHVGFLTCKPYPFAVMILVPILRCLISSGLWTCPGIAHNTEGQTTHVIMQMALEYAQITSEHAHKALQRR